MDLNKILAKSDGTSLIDHSVLTSRIGRKIANKSLKIASKNLLIQSIHLACILHDIGKATVSFQKFLRDSPNKRKFSHNEISWAFCEKYLKVKANKNIILDAIYWHHGIMKPMGTNTSSEILKTLTKGDINNMKNLVIEMLGNDYLINKTETNDNRTITLGKEATLSVNENGVVFEQ